MNYFNFLVLMEIEILKFCLTYLTSKRVIESKQL